MPGDLVLVDTSVWVDHLRRKNKELFQLLLERQVLTHAFVIGELWCGNLRNRAEFLESLTIQPHAKQAENREVFHLIEQRKLWGKGIGWVDAHLLASALLTGCRLWTLDQSLQAAALQVGIAAP